MVQFSISATNVDPLVRHAAEVKKDTIWRVSILPPSESDSGEDTWGLAAITRLQSLLRSAGGCAEEIIPENLRVSYSGGRVLVMEGPEAIESYCYTDSEKGLPHKWLIVDTKEKSDTIRIGYMSVVSQIINESPVGEAYVEDGVYLEKTYTIVGRTEYAFNDDSIVCVVEGRRIGKGNKASVSGMVHAPLTFDVFLECRGHETELTANHIIGRALQIGQLLASQPMVPALNASEVLDGYKALVSSLAGMLDAPLYFLAPKPVTLEQRHLRSPGYGVVTVQEGYAVTEKADGERMLMYVWKDRRCYLINNTFQVFETGLFANSTDMIDTLLDGEYIAWDKLEGGNQNSDIFMVFDMYATGGKSIMELPLISSNNDKTRYSEYCNAVESIKGKNTKKTEDSDNGGSIRIGAKVHVLGDKDIFAAVRKVLGGSHEYEIDGLIFTPVNIPVFAHYDGQQPKLDSVFRRSARWNRLFKWKPPAQNTIDFLVRTNGTNVDVEGKRYRAFTLLTGYNRLQWEKHTVLDALHLLFMVQRGKTIVRKDYMPMPFRPYAYGVNGTDVALLPIDEATGSVHDAVMQPIENDTIVEFGYDIEREKLGESASLCWKPLRVRDDKTRMYRAKKQIGGAANDYSVALSVWTNIHEPVSMEMISGKMPVPENPRMSSDDQPGVDDIYYASSVPREYSLSFDMLQFHNLGIKGLLYSKVPKREGKLLELACGKAGDLGRWEHSGFSLVVGVDVVADNILNAADGAYARVMSRRHRGQHPMNFMFLVGDCGKSMETQDDSDTVHLWRLVTGQSKYNERDPNRHLHSKAKGGFDMVSCQFAIHYFFKDAGMLDSFMDNVSRNLKSGGVFVGTCMDANRVDCLFDDKGTIAEGRKNGGVLWAVMRRYDLPRNTNGPYGNKVDVFLERTQQVIGEYLVDFEELTRVAASKGMVLDSTALFGDTFHQLTENGCPAIEALRTAVNNMKNDDIQKRFSFLNRWFVFRKM